MWMSSELSRLFLGVCVVWLVGKRWNSDPFASFVLKGEGQVWGVLICIYILHSFRSCMPANTQSACMICLYLFYSILSVLFYFFSSLSPCRFILFSPLSCLIHAVLFSHFFLPSLLVRFGLVLAGSGWGA